MDTQNHSAIERALTRVSAKAMASRCCVSVQAVWKWKKAKRVPAEHCLAVEDLVKGFVTRYELRPDIYGHTAPSRRRKAA